MRRISGWVTLAALATASIAGALPAIAAAESPVHEVIHQFHPNSVRASGLIQASDGDLYGTTSQSGANGAGTVFRITPAGVITTLHEFSGPDGVAPIAAVVEGTDGNFYGVTNTGGAHGIGTVFKITPTGDFTSMHSFSGTDGSMPQFDRWIQASDGNFYGTTTRGGAKNLGTVFKFDPTVDPDEAPTVTTVHSFAGSVGGSWPFAGVMEASDGNFYGTTALGGTGGVGTVFQMTPSGTVTTLHSFVRSDGAYPEAELVEGTDGALYGTTTIGGVLNQALNRGTAFKITTSGAFTTLHSFKHVDGTYVGAGLVQGADGNFYGTTNQGGLGQVGTMFKMDAAGSVTPLHSFRGADGANPESGLIQASDGNFYGTTNQGGAGNDGAIFKMEPSGTVTTVHSFEDHDGYIPRGGLIQASDGNFYGTTNVGGKIPGTVYRMDSAGTLTTIYQFTGADGQFPNNTKLVEGPDGNLYGTTSAGGGPSSRGYGTVFKLTKNGVLTSLHSFKLVDGASPSGGLTLGSDGNLYGLTWDGGVHRNGTAYKITPSGTFTSLHSFSGADGKFPFGSLTEGSDGNFYGTTNQGGEFGPGTVFKMDPTGVVTTLHSFSGGDGSQPYGGLTEGGDGSFYGTTTIGGAGFGALDGHGTVFKITPGGDFTTIHSFSRTDGAIPQGELTLGSDGNFYGTTTQGGASFNPANFQGNNGTIFRLIPTGELTSLHSFTGLDGIGPYGGPLEANDGSFYGTTEGGGLSHVGIAYRFTLGEVIEQQDTDLELTVEGRGRDMTLRARLTVLDAPAQGIEGRTVDFYSDGEHIGSVQTDNDGVASVSVPPAHRGNNRSYEAVFAGDHLFNASSDSDPARAETATRE